MEEGDDDDYELVPSTAAAAALDADETGTADDSEMSSVLHTAEGLTVTVVKGSIADQKVRYKLKIEN